MAAELGSKSSGEKVVSNNDIVVNNNIAKSQEKKRKKKEKVLEGTNVEDSVTTSQGEVQTSVSAGEGTSEIATSKNPYIEQINKRLRTLKKRLTRVEKYEEIYEKEKSKTNGKNVVTVTESSTSNSLNADQIAAVKNKGSLVTSIKELEDLKAHLEKLSLDEDVKIARDQETQNQETLQLIEQAKIVKGDENKAVIVRLLQLIVYATQAQHNPHLSQSGERLAATQFYSSLINAAYQPSPDIAGIAAKVNDFYTAEETEVVDGISFKQISLAVDSEISPLEQPQGVQFGTFSGDGVSTMPLVNIPSSGRLSFMNASEIYDQSNLSGTVSTGPTMQLEAQMQMPEPTQVTQAMVYMPEAQLAPPIPMNGGLHQHLEEQQVTVLSSQGDRWTTSIETSQQLDWAEQEDDNTLPPLTFDQPTMPIISPSQVEVSDSRRSGGGAAGAAGGGSGGGRGGGRGNRGNYRSRNYRGEGQKRSDEEWHNVGGGENLRGGRGGGRSRGGRGRGNNDRGNGSRSRGRPQSTQQRVV